jgi:acyl dehydratase
MSTKESAQITDEAIDRLRKRVGIPAKRLDRPRNTVASEDSIRDFAIGYGDDNPLFVEPSYGASTRWGGMVAPPLYFLSTGTRAELQLTDSESEAMAGGDPLRGVGQYLSSESWELFAPVTPGLRLFRSRHLHEVDVRDSSFGGGRVAVLTNRVQYADAGGRLYAINDRTYHHAERRKSAERGKYAAVELHHYSDEEIEAITESCAGESRRGPEKLRATDLTIGESLPQVVKGPLTVTDIIYYHIGIGMGGTDGPLGLAHRSRKRSPGWFTPNTLNVPDIVQRCHWESEFAQELGQPAAYDYGMMRTNWMVHLLTNWMGDDAWVSRLTVSARRFNYLGDTQWIRGRVAAIDGQASVPSVEVEIEGINQRGETTCTGAATILVCAEDGTPPNLSHTSIPELQDRCVCYRGS